MHHEAPEPIAKPNDLVWRKMTLLLQSLGMQLNVPIERGDIQRTLSNVNSDGYSEHRDQTSDGPTSDGPTSDGPTSDGPTSDGLLLWMMRAAQAARIRLAPIELNSLAAWNLVADGFIVVAINSAMPQLPWWILESTAGSGVSGILIDDSIQPKRLSNRQLTKLLNADSGYVYFVAQPALFNEFSNSTASAAADGSDYADHDAGNRNQFGHPSHDDNHLSPWRRYLRLLSPEKSDLISIAIFSFVSVVLGLATPLTVEVMVNTIGFGRSFQPILFVAIILMGILLLSGAFKILQMIVVELMQRRFFVRFVGDLSYRLPHAKRKQLEGIHGPELVNRFFDIMTIQKSSATLLLEGMTIVMQTLIGTLLLAFYHPYLLGFDFILIVCMTLVTYFLGRGGVRTAINESVVKYSVAHWLQDVVASPSAFKLHGGAEMSLDRANRLAVQYLAARKRHFLVLLRQTVFAVLLQVIALTTLFALGGYLVLIGQLTLGQLVAAELVVGVIVGAFAKSGKLIENYYDLMAATDKLGHLLDLAVDAPMVSMGSQPGPVAIRIENLSVTDPATRQLVQVGSFFVPPGGRLAIAGIVGAADSMLLPTIVGLIEPDHGFVEIDGLDARDALRFSDGSLLGYAGPREIFCGSISENIRLGRSGINDADLREAMETVNLWEEVLSLHSGLDTRLQTGGFPLSEDQIPRLMIARAIAGRPRLVLIDWCMDSLPADLRYKIWECLSAPRQPWTLLITTHDARIISEATQVFRFIDVHHSSKEK